MYNFGTKNFWSFFKQFQWLKNAQGPNYLTSGYTKDPQSDTSIDNNHTFFSDRSDGLSAVPTVKHADALNVFGIVNPNGLHCRSAAVVPLATPVAPAVTPGGAAGSTSYSYEVVAVNGQGRVLGTTPASPAGSTSTGNATLSATNPNKLVITADPLAVGYNIYRTASSGTPSTTGLIGYVACVFNSGGLVQNTVNGLAPAADLQGAALSAPGTLVFLDTGLTGDGTSAPTVNTTGAFSAGSQVDLNLVQVGTPANVTATPNGTPGSTSISYKVVAVTLTGTSPASSAGTTTTANATLTGTNSVTVKWNPVPGAVSYNIYRTSAGGTPGTTGKIGNVAANVFSFTDSGIAGDSTTPPAANTTGTVPTTAVANPTGGGNGFLQYAHAIYNFAVDGGAISTITPAVNATIPANAILVGGTINPTTAPVGAGASVAVGTTAGSATNSILAATAITSLTVDALLNAVPVFATPRKMTAAGQITVTISADPLTAGVLEIFVLYYVATNS